MDNLQNTRIYDASFVDEYCIIAQSVQGKLFYGKILGLFFSKIPICFEAV